jgi:Tfp pilus assembly protein PilN
MITLNLIPPEQKTKLKNKEVYSTIKDLLLLFLLFSIIISIMLVGSKYYLQEKLTDLMNRNSVSIQSNDNINKRIIALNAKINEVYSIQKKSQKWSSLIQEIKKLTPASVTINEINISKQESSLELMGVAKTRSDLLQLKKNLDESNLFTKINLPINSLIERENNVFDIRADINLSKIKQ